MLSAEGTCCLLVLRHLACLSCQQEWIWLSETCPATRPQELSNVLITAVRLDSSNISRSLVLALAEHVEQSFGEGMGASFSIQVCGQLSAGARLVL